MINKEKILKKLKDKTLKDSALVLVGNLISQVLSLGIVIVVTRSLSIFDYGIYSILNNISSFVQDMADMGMNGAITRFVAEFRLKGQVKKEEELINYSLKRKALNFILVFIILVLCAKPIALYWLHDEAKYPYIYLIILTCAFSLMSSALRAVLQGRQEFDRYFISVLVWNFVWAGSILVMDFTGTLTVFSSILSGVLSGIVNLLLCIKLANVNIKRLLTSKKVDESIKKKFNNFGNWMLLWSLFSLLQSKLDVFMLASFTTSEQVSYYDIASKVIKPILMVISAYAQVLNPLFASIDEEKLKEKITHVIRFIILISLLLLISIIAVKPIIKIVFGDRYDYSIFPAQLLLFAIIFFAWTVPFNSALYALNRPHVFSIAAFFGLIVTAVGDYFLLGKYGAIGAAYTYIAAQIVGLLVAILAYIYIVKERKNNA